MEQTTITKPWGGEIIWAMTDNYVGKVLYIAPKQRLSLQYHNTKSETILVIDGILYLSIDDKTVTLCAGQSWHIPPGTVHRMEAGGDCPTKIIEVSTPHLDDIVRLEDDYDRINRPR